MIMGIRNLGKNLAKRAFNAVGLDILRLPQKPSEHHQFVRLQDKEFAWLERLQVNSVLDVGANTGQFSAKIHQLLPHARIIALNLYRLVSTS